MEGKRPPMDRITDTGKQMNIDEDQKETPPTMNDAPMILNTNTSEPKTLTTEELYEEEKRRREESRVQFMIKKNQQDARPRAKSMGPPGWRPPVKEEAEHGCLGPPEPLQQPQQKGRTAQSQEEPPPPPPKRRPPTGI